MIIVCIGGPEDGTIVPVVDPPQNFIEMLEQPKPRTLRLYDGYDALAFPRCYNRHIYHLERFSVDRHDLFFYRWEKITVFEAALLVFEYYQGKNRV